MPDEGWGLHVQEYACEWCGPQRATSLYRHPDPDVWGGLSQEEAALELHRNDHHRWDERTRTWSR